jgi:opine dehydrogenase
MAETVAPYLGENQVIVLNPGNVGGAIQFYKTLKAYGLKYRIPIGETSTLVYACRKTGGNKVWIKSTKNQIDFGVYPAKDTERVAKIINVPFPQFRPVTNSLEVGLNNIAMAVHPTIMMFNAARVEAKTDFYFYVEGLTPSLANVMEAVDIERCRVMEKLGLKPIQLGDWLNLFYGVQGDTVFDRFKAVESYKHTKAPKTLEARQLVEDVPFGLVPTSSLGNMIGVPTPIMDAVIDLSSVLMKRDFRKLGRNVETLGIKNKSVEEIKDLLQEGE